MAGLIPDALASVVDVRWFGTNAIELTYTSPDGAVAQQLLYRDDEPRLRIAAEGRPWTFDGDGAAFRLVSEAKRIHLAYLFDPFVAVTTSLVEPLPHQITAVYEEMLPRQPLNYLLADDPGAGKTIMTGLLIRELVIRGDLRRCLIVVPGAHLQALLAERGLGADVLDARRVATIREQMERADARRLQPHFIRAFFLEAFRSLGGTIRAREPGRFEISHVPGRIRERARLMGLHPGVLRAYERVTFDKDRINPAGLALAAYLCPGHPLLEATIDLLLGDGRDLFRRGAYLLDPADLSDRPRVLLYLEHTISDARPTRTGQPSVVSRRLEFVELGADGTAANAGPAPYQDYAPLEAADRTALAPVIAEAAWLTGAALEERALGYAIEHLARGHLAEVRARTDERVARTRAAVQERLTYEINYWDHRASQLGLAEQTGKTAALNSAKARARADDLAERLRSRLHELDQEAQLGSQPPLIVGGAIVVPQGLLDRLHGAPATSPAEPTVDAQARARIEALAMAAVMAAETARGGAPRDVSAENLGYDIEAHDPDTGRLRFLEVKGRAAGATTVTLTRNEIIEALNVPDAWRLVLVAIDGDAVGEPRYLSSPVTREPDYGVVSQNYAIADLLKSPEAEVA